MEHLLLQNLVGSVLAGEHIYGDQDSRWAGSETQRQVHRDHVPGPRPPPVHPPRGRHPGDPPGRASPGRNRPTWPSPRSTSCSSGSRAASATGAGSSTRCLGCRCRKGTGWNRPRGAVLCCTFPWKRWRRCSDSEEDLVYAHALRRALLPQFRIAPALRPAGGASGGLLRCQVSGMFPGRRHPRCGITLRPSGSIAATWPAPRPTGSGRHGSISPIWRTPASTPSCRSRT